MRSVMTFFLLSFAASSAFADVIYNNLGPGDTFSFSGRILTGPDHISFGDINQAASFSVGPTAHYLTDVVLGLGVRDTPASPFVPSSVNVVVREDNSGAPGAGLLTLPYPITTPGDQAITVQDAGSVMLAANTDYWVIADAQGGFDGAWRFNNQGAMGLTAGQTNGNAWNLRPNDEMYALRVNGNPVVPEPATLLLACSGLVGLLGFLSRYRRPESLSSAGK